MEFKSNTELFEPIEKLRKELSSSGCEEAGNLISEGMSGLNGLTDGWAYLLEHLDSTKQKYGSALSPEQSAKLAQIQSIVYKVVHRS